VNELLALIVILAAVDASVPAPKSIFPAPPVKAKPIVPQKRRQ
jgi:hypothetical protein